MYPDTVLLVAAKTVTLLCGVVLTWLTYKAYRRTGSPAMRALWVGIGFVTAGAMLAGGVHQLLGLPVALSSTVQSLFTATGFAVLTYSLYTEQPAPS
ncbi:DUF7521 family protein [Haloarcula litorea]|uniref:DUF7521 family protein n=1 Tax=Haloarcula litorea TaxID=3032579 RepID=UPI0023E762E7|nr:hypothetical protein [Halomicroarcula sp. GDY20]